MAIFRDRLIARRLFSLSLLCLAFSADAAEIPAPAHAPVAIQEGAPNPPPAPSAPLVLKLNDSADAARVAQELARSLFDDKQWAARVADVRRKFADWEKENDGDMGSFLNYRLPAVALSVSGGKIERLKEGAAFVALYREFGQPLPKLVTEFARENLESLNALFAAYTWEKAGEYVKNHQWQKDRAAAKQKAASAKP